MSSSIFGAEQRIGEPLSALAVLTGRHREKKHARPNFSQKSTNIGNMVYLIIYTFYLGMYLFKSLTPYYEARYLRNK